MKKIICLISLIGLIFLKALALAETDIIVKGNVIKQISTKEVTIETLKQRFASLKTREQAANNELIKVQNEIQAFKALLNKAGIDFSSW